MHRGRQCRGQFHRPRRRHVVYTHAGPEIAVASTKAYNTQLAALYLLSLHAAERMDRLPEDRYRRYVDELLAIPGKLETLLLEKETIQRFAAQHFNARSVFFIGRGLDYALSMEASLKLKEISYIHSEAYPGGELKHGTIALIEDGTLVVCPMTQPALLDKMLGNVREVKARGATVLGLVCGSSARPQEVCDALFRLPEVDPLFAPILAVTPAQTLCLLCFGVQRLDMGQDPHHMQKLTVE